MGSAGLFERIDAGRVPVIAEIGNNHEGKLELAREMVHRAAASGVDAVKFQTFKTELFVSPDNPQRFATLKSFELPHAQFAELAGLARELGLLFLSTPLDLHSARFLAGHVDAFKIASGDNDFYPLLEVVAASGKPLLLSTGVSDMEQVDRTLSFVRQQWSDRRIDSRIAVLHCVSSYPVPPEQANLRSIPYLAGRLDVPVGYSDHTVGIDAALLAVALGAQVIEKHFTLDHHYSDFRDHQLSADPSEMSALVDRVSTATRMLGAASKEIQPAEAQGCVAFRRSIAAARDLPRGHRIEFEDLAWLRPAGGIRPGEEDRVLGATLLRDLRAGEALRPELLQRDP